MSILPGFNSYRKLPKEVEAIQYDGTNARSIVQIINGMTAFSHVTLARETTSMVPGKGATPQTRLIIPTPEGEMAADKGDWIIRGIKGEFYPCKPDIFADTYEEVE